MDDITEVGAAVIGTGFIGTVHVETLRRLGVQVRGVLGSTPERGRARAASIGVANAYSSIEALLDDPKVDVVHVTTPNDLHLPQSRAALEAGRHVVCEKPLTLTPDESAVLVDLAASSGRVNAVCFTNRHYPVNQHAHDVVADGAIGDVRLVTGRYFQDWLTYDTDWNWRILPERGGWLRAVGDIGSHWLDLVSFVTGRRVEAVMADLATFVPTRDEPAGPVETFAIERSGATTPRRIETEDAASILLRFEGGARGSVTVSQVSPGRKNLIEYEVDGSTGAVAWDSERPDELWLGHRDRPNEVLIKNPALLSPGGRRTATLPAGHVEGFGDTFGALFRAVYADVVAGGPSDRPPYPTFADGHEQMLVGQAVAASAAAGRWVGVARD